jgi:hypothetical protein
MGRDVREAEQYAGESLDLFRRAGVARGEAHATMALGAIAEHTGDPSAADRHYLEAIRICWEERAEIQTALCLEALLKLRATHRPGPATARLSADVAHVQQILGLPRSVGAVPPGGETIAAIDRSRTLADVVMYVLSEPISYDVD